MSEDVSSNTIPTEEAHAFITKLSFHIRDLVKEKYGIDVLFTLTLGYYPEQIVAVTNASDVDIAIQVLKNTVERMENRKKISFHPYPIEEGNQCPTN